MGPAPGIAPDPARIHPETTRTTGSVGPARLPLGCPDASRAVRLPASGQWQGPRTVSHRRRSSVVRRDRSDLSVRLRAGQRDTRQRAHLDRDERVLLRSRRGAQPSGRTTRRSAYPRRGPGPRAGGATTRHGARRVRRPRVSDRFGLTGLSAERQSLWHHLAAGPRRGQQVRDAVVHAGDESRTGTTRREYPVRQGDRNGRRSPRQPVARPYFADLRPGGRPRAPKGNHHRRHQIRVRRRCPRRPGAGRRGLHPRLVALLACGRLPRR